jgi:pectate lyase
MSSSGESVRIGPISIFTLIAVICLAVLSVLAVTTASASLNMAKLQASSMTQQYGAENAAQTFLAQVDERANAATGSGTDRANAISGSLSTITKSVQSKASDGVTVTASTKDANVNAQFACEDGRVLDISIELHADGSYKIAKWNMTAKRNDAQTENLWSGM